MTAKEILEQVQSGGISVKEAERFFQEQPYDDLGYANLDLHRQVRTGFPEAVYCAGKEEAHLVGIYQKLYEKNGAVLGTRATQLQADAVRAVLPDVLYDSVSHILQIVSAEYETYRGGLKGCVAVCSGGTADVPAAEEAAQTAEFLGARVDRIYDVGVSGIHRLFQHLDRLRAANAVIAVAGMEGALPGVVAGLVENPVIAVPTSVGYGANLQGISALLTMLNACSNGVTVVNIDNGYGAGFTAAQINRLAVQAQKAAAQTPEGGNS